MCVATCSTPSGSGGCETTATSCGGSFLAGYCPGPSDVQCCVAGATPPPTGSGVLGVDLSATPPASFWTCATTEYKVVVIRGYIQGCARGGVVASNFVENYKASKAAGIPRIDAYLFPCTGTQDTGVACKTPTAQVNEFLKAVDDNNMAIDHYWFDLEPTSTANGDACNAWNLGGAANAALAKEWVAALKATGRKWGIYANGNQWTTMFASRSTDIGSELPLWAVQADSKPGVNTVTTFMGGWTSAVAKQYRLGRSPNPSSSDILTSSGDTTSCGASVDLDSFL
ncbi:putative GH family 25 lysozyme 4 [Halenospora varia]|nr:putative GH family 25 lysozyme 4 [Halenospora varia]